MEKPIIMLDLDDTICDLSTLLQESLHSATGKNISVDLWDDYNLGNIYGMDPKVVFDVIIKDGLYSKVEPLPGIQKGIKALSTLGYEVVIVTARQSADPQGIITREWIRKHQIACNRFILTNHHDGKDKIAESLEPDYSLDDNLNYVHSCAEHVGQSFIRHMPWNTDDQESFERVHHFDEFVERISMEPIIPARWLN